MLPVLIGSRAMNFWLDRSSKPTSDWDVISAAPLEGCEWHNPVVLNNATMAVDYNSYVEIEHPDGHRLWVMTPVGLGIIKRSHLWRDTAFDKHITMYHKCGMYNWVQPLLTSTAYPLVASDLHERTRLTHIAYPQVSPSLKQTKVDFFNDFVVKVYDHDYLHELAAFNNQPMYARMLTDPTTVWCSKVEWEQFSTLEQCQTVVEEAIVIASERYLIPSNWEYPINRAYMNAVQKICTTLCSGWFRDFAIDNYPAIIAMFDFSKFHYIRNTLK